MRILNAETFSQIIPHRTTGKILVRLPTPLLILLAIVYTRLFEVGKPDPEMLSFVSNVTRGCTILEVGLREGSLVCYPHVLANMVR